MTIANARKPWRICVVIPARNEEQLIERCLRSVLEARQAIARSDQVDIVVVCDACTDSTAIIANRYLNSTGAVIVSRSGVVGEARRKGVRLALKRSHGHRCRCWIASTDADCVVPKHWLADQLKLARAGFDVVAGTVDVDSFEDHEPGVRHRFRETYLIQADGSHPHVHGANLGFSATAYEQAGGWSGLATAEDHDLWRRLCNTGARVTSTNTIQVVTSGRRIGRAPSGFAKALAAHNENAA